MRQRGVKDLAHREPTVTLPATLEVETAPPLVLEDLFAAQSRRLVGALTVFTGDVAEAEDLAQEAFARVHANRSRLREPDRAVSYLYSVAFNLARSRWRRQASHGRALLRLGRNDDVGRDAAVITAEHEEAATTLAAVASLPERQRACVLLHYYAELSVAETATAMHISSNSVKTHLRRALVAMRASLGEEDRS